VVTPFVDLCFHENRPNGSRLQLAHPRRSSHRCQWQKLGPPPPGGDPSGFSPATGFSGRRNLPQGQNASPHSSFTISSSSLRLLVALNYLNGLLNRILCYGEGTTLIFPVRFTSSHPLVQIEILCTPGRFPPFLFPMPPPPPCPSPIDDAKLFFVYACSSIGLNLAKLNRHHLRVESIPGRNRSP